MLYCQYVNNRWIHLKRHFAKINIFLGKSISNANCLFLQLTQLILFILKSVFVNKAKPTDSHFSKKMFVKSILLNWTCKHLLSLCWLLSTWQELWIKLNILESARVRCICVLVESFWKMEIIHNDCKKMVSTRFSIAIVLNWW